MKKKRRIQFRCVLQYLLLRKDVTLSTCHNDKSELNASHPLNAVETSVDVVLVGIKTRGKKIEKKFLFKRKEEEEEDMYLLLLMSVTLSSRHFDKSALKVSLL